MICFDGWYFPDGEKHLQEWMESVGERVDGRLTYQYAKYEKAMQYVSDNSLAIDVGSHVGLWAFYMARDFDNVACFEPMQAHRECWYKNMQDCPNAELFPLALGEIKKKVSLVTGANSSGDTRVDGVGDIDMVTLDSLNFNNVGFIKIDCEGYEMNVLYGAVETIKRCKPVMVIEQKPQHGARYGFADTEAVIFMKSLGAKLVATISGDYIFAWD